MIASFSLATSKEALLPQSPLLIIACGRADGDLLFLLVSLIRSLRTTVPPRSTFDNCGTRSRLFPSNFAIPFATSTFWFTTYTGFLAASNDWPKSSFTFEVHPTIDIRTFTLCNPQFNNSCKGCFKRKVDVIYVIQEWIVCIKGRQAITISTLHIASIYKMEICKNLAAILQLCIGQTSRTKYYHQMPSLVHLIIEHPNSLWIKLDHNPYAQLF